MWEPLLKFNEAAVGNAHRPYAGGLSAPWCLAETRAATKFIHCRRRAGRLIHGHLTQTQKDFHDDDTSIGKRLSRSSEFAVIQAMAPSLRVEVNPVNMRDAGEIERAVVSFARSPNGGLIVTGGSAATFHRELIITLAARHKLPTVYWVRFFVDAGGLISYGPDVIDQYRQAAGYVDRILEIGRSAGGSADQVRAGDQPQDGQDARPHHPGNTVGHRRRGDPVKRREFIAGLRGGVASGGAGAADRQGLAHRVSGRTATPAAMPNTPIGTFISVRPYCGSDSAPAAR
jgi:hypothetical protein